MVSHKSFLPPVFQSYATTYCTTIRANLKLNVLTYKMYITCQGGRKQVFYGGHDWIEKLFFILNLYKSIKDGEPVPPSPPVPSILLHAKLVMTRLWNIEYKNVIYIRTLYIPLTNKPTTRKDDSWVVPLNDFRWRTHHRWSQIHFLLLLFCT